MTVSKRFLATTVLSLLLLALSVLPALATTTVPTGIQPTSDLAASSVSALLLDYTYNVQAASGGQVYAVSAPAGSNVKVTSPGLFVLPWTSLISAPGIFTSFNFAATGRLDSVSPLTITFRSLAWTSGIGQDVALLNATRGFSMGDNQFSIGPVVSPLGVSYTVSGTLRVRLAELNVNGATGDDARGNGSAGNPFKTISAALAVATAGQVVRVAPGTYEAGEEFPLVVKPGVDLEGQSRDTTVIRGSDTPAIIQPGSNAAVRHLKIVNATSGVTETVSSIWIDGASPTIEDNEITTNEGAGGCRTGVLVTGSTPGAVLRGNRIHSNRSQICGGDGVSFPTSGSTATLEDNQIDNNDIGVELHGGTPNLTGNQITGGGIGLVALCKGANCSVGGSAALNTIAHNQTGVSLGQGAAIDFGGGGSKGSNTFSCNTSIDFFNGSSRKISAQWNFWDHTPPSGNDLWHSGSDSSTTTEVAFLAASPCP